MPKDNLRLEITGLDALKQSINEDRINKQIALGVGQAAKTLHSEIRSAIFKRYKTKYDLNSVWIGNSVSLTNVGKNVIKGSLFYQYKPITLARYLSSITPGNIPPLPKKRLGRVVRVEVRRGNRKVVYGKNGKGGFIPAYKDGRLKTDYPGFTGSSMFERTGKSRYPIIPLFGLSLTDMVTNVWANDADVKRAKEAASSTILGFIKDDS